jgi:hypothetical protein
LVNVRKEGFMLSIIADMIKGLILRYPSISCWILLILITPLLELIVFLENKKILTNNYLTNFPAGYFFVVKKK